MKIGVEGHLAQNSLGIIIIIVTGQVAVVETRKCPGMTTDYLHKYGDMYPDIVVFKA